MLSWVVVVPPFWVVVVQGMAWREAGVLSCVPVHTSISNECDHNEIQAGFVSQSLELVG